MRDIPVTLKKPVTVKAPLPNGLHHQLTLRVYLPADILAFLKGAFKAYK